MHIVDVGQRQARREFGMQCGIARETVAAEFSREGCEVGLFWRRKRLSALLAAGIWLVTTHLALAQKDPAQAREWGAMYNRMDKITHPYQAKLGLAHYWGTYCLNVVNSTEAAHPKDGGWPLGITDWRTLSHEDFTSALSILEEYRTAEMMLCLADVKAKLNAAESH